MKCPNCNNEYTRVKETRVIEENPQWVKRRRMCPNCEHQFWTVEMPAEDVVIGGDYE